ncbi:MAG: hypothetical protein HKN33_05870 [Pyrinomonadaceae bacterium]|nr:hypothetical protein [Pyrinomonadaceae bacterium]
MKVHSDPDKEGRTLEVTALLDVDGDGRLEIVAYDYEYEGSGSVAHIIIDGKSTKVLGSGEGV